MWQIWWIGKAMLTWSDLLTTQCGSALFAFFWRHSMFSQFIGLNPSWNLVTDMIQYLAVKRILDCGWKYILFLGMKTFWLCRTSQRKEFYTGLLCNNLHQQRMSSVWDGTSSKIIVYTHKEWVFLARADYLFSFLHLPYWEVRREKNVEVVIVIMNGWPIPITAEAVTINQVTSLM